MTHTHITPGYPADNKNDNKLFHEALVENSETAWGVIFTKYHRLVASWVTGYSRFWDTGEEVDFFVIEAFVRLWRYGAPHARSGRITYLAQYLQYLKRCTWSSIEDHIRRIRKDALWSTSEMKVHAIPNDKIAEPSNEYLSICWKVAQNNPQETLIAEESWVLGLKPGEIYARHAGIFQSIREVYQIKRNLVRRLRNHPQMPRKYY